MISILRRRASRSRSMTSSFFELVIRFSLKYTSWAGRAEAVWRSIVGKGVGHLAMELLIESSANRPGG